MQTATATQGFRLAGPSESDFLKLAAHLKRLSGINLPLNEKNLALMSSRLQKLRAGGDSSFKDIIGALDRGDARTINFFVSAMTTNTTHFFREAQHFDFLTKVVEERTAKGELKVWCAASSTGEEPYALAMWLDNLRAKHNLNFKMLATDIDYKVLATAKTGIYTEKQLENVPANFLQTYFAHGEGDDDGSYRVKESLKAQIQFGRFNLLKNYPFKGHFDVIFCRNVLIYFDKETVNYVVTQMQRVLQPGGYLFLGHSEAIAGMVPGLKRAGPAIYRRI